MISPERFRRKLTLDGSTGRYLMAHGMQPGVCPELWVTEHPEVLIELQRSYIEAGSEVILAPTFGANRARLADYGLADRTAELNRELVAISRRAVSESGREVLVAGDISPTGLMIEPFGEASFEDIVGIYREQLAALREAGVDFVSFETMMSIWEGRAGLLAAMAEGMPATVSVTLDGSHRTLMGEPLSACVVAFQSLGALAAGVNCAEGPVGLYDCFKEALPYARIPLIAKPNAGRPCPDDPLRYDLSVEDFAREMERIASLGVSVLGGCCGTTSEHIAALGRISVGEPAHGFVGELLSTERMVFELPERPRISESLVCDYELEDALMECEDSFDIARVRLETEQELARLAEASFTSGIPLCLDCQSPELTEKALRRLCGRVAVCVKSEREKELCKGYGALAL